MIKHSVLLMAALAFLPASASSQFQGTDVVDRLVAIVGDSVVVQTQVQEEIQRMALGGNPVPDPSDPEYQTLFRTVLQQFVDRMLILQAAAKDTLIQPDEATIDQRVNDRITQLAQQFGGQPALQTALAAEALTLAEYRDILKSEARSEQIQQMFFQLRMRDAPPMVVTEEELLARFQEARTSLKQRPNCSPSVRLSSRRNPARVPWRWLAWRRRLCWSASKPGKTSLSSHGQIRMTRVLLHWGETWDSFVAAGW